MSVARYTIGDQVKIVDVRGRTSLLDPSIVYAIRDTFEPEYPPNTQLLYLNPGNIEIFSDRVLPAEVVDDMESWIAVRCLLGHYDEMERLKTKLYRFANVDTNKKILNEIK
jgi:hypothetical protein